MSNHDEDLTFSGAFIGGPGIMTPAETAKMLSNDDEWEKQVISVLREKYKNIEKTLSEM